MLLSNKKRTRWLSLPWTTMGVRFYSNLHCCFYSQVVSRAKEHPWYRSEESLSKSHYFASTTHPKNTHKAVCMACWPTIQFYSFFASRGKFLTVCGKHESLAEPARFSCLPHTVRNLPREAKNIKQVWYFSHCLARRISHRKFAAHARKRLS